jgi:predicted PolB exonuclease-like 3'-5' exonuclease
MDNHITNIFIFKFTQERCVEILVKNAGNNLGIVIIPDISKICYINNGFDHNLNDITSPFLEKYSKIFKKVVINMVNLKYYFTLWNSTVVIREIK